MSDRFVVESWDENELHSLEEGNISRATVVLQYHGVMEGNSVVEYTLVHMGDGTARFSQIERFEGTIDGKAGVLVLQGGGSFENNVASGVSHVVKGEGELLGVQGRKAFSAGHEDARTYEWQPL